MLINSYGNYYKQTKQTNMFQKLKDRWNSETPIVYKKIRNISVSLSGSATALLAVSSTANIIVPVILIKAASWVIIVGAVTAGYSQLQTKKEDNNV